MQPTKFIFSDIFYSLFSFLKINGNPPSGLFLIFSILPILFSVLFSYFILRTTTFATHKIDIFWYFSILVLPILSFCRNMLCNLLNGFCTLLAGHDLRFEKHCSRFNAFPLGDLRLTPDPFSLTSYPLPLASAYLQPSHSFPPLGRLIAAHFILNPSSLIRKFVACVRTLQALKDSLP